jgi:predicted transcriptional regulator
VSPLAEYGMHSDSRWVTPSWLARAANCPDDRTEDLIDAPVSRGLVKRDEDEDAVKLTEQGIAFSKASLTTVTRKTANCAYASIQTLNCAYRP